VIVDLVEIVCSRLLPGSGVKSPAGWVIRRWTFNYKQLDYVVSDDFSVVDRYLCEPFTVEYSGQPVFKVIGIELTSHVKVRARPSSLFNMPQIHRSTIDFQTPNNNNQFPSLL
jgi:hypothetical protein